MIILGLQLMTSLASSVMAAAGSAAGKAMQPCRRDLNWIFSLTSCCQSNLRYDRCRPYFGMLSLLSHISLQYWYRKEKYFFGQNSRMFSCLLTPPHKEFCFIFAMRLTQRSVILSRNGSGTKYRWTKHRRTKYRR